MSVDLIFVSTFFCERNTEMRVTHKQRPHHDALCRVRSVPRRVNSSINNDPIMIPFVGEGSKPSQVPNLPRFQTFPGSKPSPPLLQEPISCTLTPYKIRIVSFCFRSFCVPGGSLSSGIQLTKPCENFAVSRSACPATAPITRPRTFLANRIGARVPIHCLLCAFAREMAVLCHPCYPW